MGTHVLVATYVPMEVRECLLRTCGAAVCGISETMSIFAWRSTEMCPRNRMNGYESIRTGVVPPASAS